MRVNFYDPERTNNAYLENFGKNINEIILRHKTVVNGKFTKRFENDFADYVGAKYCVHLSTGLDALRLSLVSHGIGNGDRVVLPAHSYIAAWIPVLEIGAIPIGVKVDESSLLMSPESLSQIDLTNIKAIMPVHLYGQACEIEAISRIASSLKIPIIEDAAQAHGALTNRQKIGSFNNTTCFSFYPTKNLGGIGEGGAVITNNELIYERICSLRNYGRESGKEGVHQFVSGNYRGDELQAAFLIEKLKYLDKINTKRCELIQRYRKNLASINNDMITLLDTDKNCAAHIALVRAKNQQIRDDLRRSLHEKGVDTIIHYPVAVSDQPCMKNLRIEFTNEAKAQSRNISNTILSLPLHEGLTVEEVDYTSECILNYTKKG